ncbi:unnamed protein product [Rhizophagus irregularis]|nr:unnamed protein product [Rhizophagus irregularis]
MNIVQNMVKYIAKIAGVKFTQTRYKWCKPCINIFTKWTIKNEKLVGLIQEMHLGINSCFNIVFEWIPYNQFNYIKEIGKGGFATVYSAIWKDGPLKYDIDKKMYTRVSNKKVKEYSISKKSDILSVYGISQNPDTSNFIIVLEYAEGGSYSNWINNNYKDFDWKNKIQTLLYIIEGLKGIHQNQKVHHDLHPGNILFLTKSLNTFNNKSLFISDMGLCEDVSNTGEATGKQPFNNCAHDHPLILDICDGVRPEINELEAPKCYIDLMRRCWDSNPDNRPNASEINVGIKSFYDCYSSYKKSDSNAIEIRKQFKEAEIYRKSCLSSFKKNKNHPEAIYTSQLLDPITKDLRNSECLSCAIPD